MTIYNTIQSILAMIREGSRDFEKMLEMLKAEDVDLETAQSLLDRLLQQVEDE